MKSYNMTLTRLACAAVLSLRLLLLLLLLFFSPVRAAPGCDPGIRLPGGEAGAARASRATVIFNPDFFVERLRHEQPEVFTELVLSNLTRLIDLPGTEFSELLGEGPPKTPTGGHFFTRSLNFLKRKGQTCAPW